MWLLKRALSGLCKHSARSDTDFFIIFTKEMLIRCGEIVRGLVRAVAQGSKNITYIKKKLGSRA